MTNQSQPKRLQGRPALTKLEGMRRKMKRMKLKVDELKVLSEIEGASEAPEPVKRRGRKALTGQQKHQKEVTKFTVELAVLRTMEDAEGEAHVDLEAVEDPSLDAIGMPKVGRRWTDALGVLDRKLKKANKDLELALALPDSLNHPIKTGGRRSIPKFERVRRAKLAITTLEARILQEEGELNEGQMQRRGLKKLRDSAHVLRIRLRKFDKLDDLDQSELEQISIIKERLVAQERFIQESELRCKYLDEMKEHFDEHDEIETKLKNLASDEIEEQIVMMRRKKILVQELNRLKTDIDGSYELSQFKF